MFNTDTVSRFNNLETPFYYYDLNLLKQTLQACTGAENIEQMKALAERGKGLTTFINQVVKSQYAIKVG